MVQESARQRIQYLSPQLANQIAAGEVIERPASVVKELLENSIDAGARNIEVEVEQGGTTLIRIRDDGVGIPGEELPLALASHATSKIHSLTDLDKITTLGFRGEALASIASVSRLVITSRTADADQGWQSSGANSDIQPAPHPVGTSVEMRDLFYNTPARKKFLRAVRTEFLHVEEVVRRVALSHFDIGFTLYHNGRQLFRLRPANDDTTRRQRITSLLGRPFLQHALAVDFKAAGLRVAGWVTTPSHARSQADIQYVFLNGRIIRDRVVTHALRQAYGDRILPGRYPAYLLYLEIDPGQVDVNVHPTKHEVRFREARMVHDFLFSSLSSALGKGVTETSLNSEPVVPVATERRYASVPASANRVAERRETYHQLRTITAAREQEETESTLLPLGYPLALLYGRYILAENSKGLVLVDRLLAHRRLVFERLQGVLADEVLRGRPLLIPVTFNVSPELCAIPEQCAETLLQLAFVIEPLGDNSLVVRQVPSLLESVSIEQLINTLLQHLQTKGCGVDDKLLGLLAGQIQLDTESRMSPSEMERLLRRLESVESSYSPPSLARVWRELDQDDLVRLIQG